MKKTICALSLVLAVLLSLAACQAPNAGQASNSPAASAAPSGSAAPSASQAAAVPNFNPTGYPIAPQTVTLRVLFSTNADMPSDLHQIPLIQKDEKTTNVKIDYVLVPSAGWAEKKNLMLSTGDLPDIIESAIPSSDLTKYGPDGTFIKMQDLIAKYATNFTNIYKEIPSLQAYITAPDGNIYGLCRINSGPWMNTNGVGIINKAWLDKLNLKMPTTIDEFHNVLKEFKTKDPNGNGAADEIPMSFQALTDQSMTANNGLGYIFTAFGIAANGNSINGGSEAYADVQNGKVVCIATLPQYKEAIKYLATLYKEGLIDIEGFTQDSTAFRGKLNNKPATIGYTQVWDINDIVSNPDNNAAYEYMPPLTGPNGSKPVFYQTPLPGIVRGWGVITKACKTPEVAMRWLDYFFEPTNSIEHIEGPIGVRVLDKGDGTLYVRKPPQGLSVAQDRFSNCNAGILGMVPSIYTNKLKLPSTDKKVAFVKSIINYADPDPMQPVYYNADESNEMATLQNDIKTYIERKMSEWIMQGNVDADWDAYLKEIDKIGLPKWISIKQAAYDRFMANAKK